MRQQDTSKGSGAVVSSAALYRGFSFKSQLRLLLVVFTLFLCQAVYNNFLPQSKNILWLVHLFVNTLILAHSRLIDHVLCILVFQCFRHFHPAITLIGMGLAVLVSAEHLYEFILMCFSGRILFFF